MKEGKVLTFFRDILRIPRESGHEEHMIEYLLEFGRSRGLDTKRDEIGNVLITKPAAKGCEEWPTVVLQSHQDMVCEKNGDVKHDFAKDAINAYVKDGWMRAKGTTLGADDGIGIASELAILDDPTLKLGKIECLFTISEETGLDGANAISDDFFTGKILINLDSEDWGQLFIGCAGGIDTTATFKYFPRPMPEGEKSYITTLRKAGILSEDAKNKLVALVKRIIAQLVGWREKTRGEGAVPSVKTKNPEDVNDGSQSAS